MIRQQNVSFPAYPLPSVQSSEFDSTFDTFQPKSAWVNLNNPYFLLVYYYRIKSRPNSPKNQRPDDVIKVCTGYGFRRIAGNYSENRMPDFQIFVQFSISKWIWKQLPVNANHVLNNLFVLYIYEQQHIVVFTSSRFLHSLCINRAGCTFI